MTTIYGRQSLEADHLVVSTLEQAGRLPADTPDLAAVTDASGRVSSLESFRDGNPDPDVTALGPKPTEALARIARDGPPGAGPDWEASVRGYEESIKIELARLDPTTPMPIRGSSWSPTRSTAPGEGSCAVGLHVNRGPVIVAMLALAVLTTLTGCTNTAEPGASPSTPVDTEVPFAAPAGISDADYDVDTFDTCSPFRSTLWLKAAVVDRRLGTRGRAGAGGELRVARSGDHRGRRRRVRPQPQGRQHRPPLPARGARLGRQLVLADGDVGRDAGVPLVPRGRTGPTGDGHPRDRRDRGGRGTAPRRR